MLYAGVNAHGLNWHRNLPRWWIGHHVGYGKYYVIVCLRFHSTQPHLIPSLLRCHLWHLGLSGDNIKNLHKLSKCCQWWCGCCRICLRLHNSRNLQVSRPIHHISLREVVGCVHPSRLSQLVKPHLLLPKALHAALYRFGDCAHLPARFIIFTQLAKLWIFLIIILIFLILLILGTSKNAHTVSNRIQHLLNCCFMLCGCRSCLFNIPHMFLLLHNRCLCILNLLFCHCSLSIHIILDPFLIFFIAWKVGF